ncbi:NAD(P)-binding protein [Sarocladium strictum]
MPSEIDAWTYGPGGYPAALNRTKIQFSDAPLRPTEVLIRVKAAALNPVDIQLMNYPILPSLPSWLVPVKGVGEDFAGIIEQAGNESGFKPGDEVLGVIFPFPNGTFQEMIRIDTTKSDNAIVRKPQDWSWKQAAALPLAWSTACSLIQKVESYVGESGKVAVLGGSSASGMYAVYLARKRGWEVIATCSSAKAELVTGMGANDTIDYRTANVPAKLKEHGLDATIDCVGGTECIGLAKRYVTIVGDKTSRMSLGGSATYLFYPQMVWRSFKGLIGLGPSYLCINYAIKNSFLEELLKMPKEKVIIDSTYSFQEVKEAYERMNGGRATGKVVITLD